MTSRKSFARLSLAALQIFTFLLTTLLLANCSTDESFDVMSNRSSLESGNGGGNDDDTSDDDDEGKDDDDSDDEEEGDDQASRRDQSRRCSEKLGVSASKLVVVGSKEIAHMTSDQALLLRVVGYKNKVSFTLNNASRIAGICVVTVGRKSAVSLKIQGEVEKVAYVAVGSRSQGDIEVERGGQICGSFQAALFGFNNALKLHGQGQYSCPVRSRVGGMGNTLDCAR